MRRMSKEDVRATVLVHRAFAQGGRGRLGLPFHHLETIWDRSQSVVSRRLGRLVERGILVRDAEGLVREGPVMARLVRKWRLDEAVSRRESEKGEHT